MPVRNAERWLDEALASIVAQSLDDWELLAVDDGSSDASRALLDRCADGDRRVHVMSTPSHERGIVSALNIALKRASGEFVARMDADDVSAPLRLQRQVEILDAEPELAASTCRVAPVLEPIETVNSAHSSRPSGGAADFDPDSYQGMKRYLAWQNALLDPVDLFRDRFVECPLLHPTLMMRTGCLRDDLGGWKHNGWPEDWDLILRAFSIGWRCRRAPEVLYSWRLHAKQSMRNDPVYSTQQFLAARCHYLARHLRSPIFHDRELWVLGAGPTGKLLARRLYEEGLSIAGFADIDPRKIGGRIQYREAAWPVIDSNELLETRPRPFALSAVGSAAGRGRVRELLNARGWREEHDFVAAA